MPKRTDNFQKFVKQKKGSAIKEEIKQQKKKEKKERAAAIEAHFERKRAERLQREQGQQSASNSKPTRSNKYPKTAAEPAEKKFGATKAAKGGSRAVSAEKVAPAKTGKVFAAVKKSEKTSEKTTSNYTDRASTKRETGANTRGQEKSERTNRRPEAAQKADRDPKSTCRKSGKTSKI